MAQSCSPTREAQAAACKRPPRGITTGVGGLHTPPAPSLAPPTLSCTLPALSTLTPAGRSTPPSRTGSYPTRAGSAHTPVLSAWPCVQGHPRVLWPCRWAAAPSATLFLFLSSSLFLQGYQGGYAHLGAWLASGLSAEPHRRTQVMIQNQGLLLGPWVYWRGGSTLTPPSCPSSARHCPSHSKVQLTTPSPLEFFHCLGSSCEFSWSQPWACLHARSKYRAEPGLCCPSPGDPSLGVQALLGPLSGTESRTLASKR